MQRKFNPWLILPSLALFLIVWTLIGSVYTPVVDHVDAVDGYADLSGFDLANKIAHVSGKYEYYPNALYAPEDFAEGEIPHSTLTNDDTYKIQYGTFRLLVKLPPGVVYGLAAYSLDFAEKLYVNGKLVNQSGKVVSEASSAVPSTTYSYVYFQPDSEITEIVVQFSNFVHRQGGDQTAYNISHASNITRLGLISTFDLTVVFGCLLMAGIYYLGLFILNTNRRVYLYFALMCLCLLTFSNRLMFLIMQNIPWHFYFRMRYSMTYLLWVFTSLYAYALFPKYMHRKVVALFCGIFLLFLISALTFPTALASKVKPVYWWVSVALVVYCLIMLAIHLKSGGFKARAMFAGLLVYLVFQIYDIGIFSNYIYTHVLFTRIPLLYNVRFGSDQGMVCVLFVFMLINAVDTAQTDAALEKERAENALLALEKERLQEKADKTYDLLQKSELTGQIVASGPLVLDCVAGQAFLDGKDMTLSPKEFALLLVLAQNKGKALSKEFLYEAVWKAPQSGDGNALWKQMSRLKKKLEGSSVVLRALRGEGYLLDIDSPHPDTAIPAD